MVREANAAPLPVMEQVTGLDALKVSAMVGRQLPFFSVLVPFWVVAAFAGWRGMMGVWPAALLAGVAFAVPQFLVSNYHGPWLVDIAASLVSLAAIVLLLRVWRPRDLAVTQESLSRKAGAAAEPPLDPPGPRLGLRPFFVWPPRDE